MQKNLNSTLFSEVPNPHLCCARPPLHSLVVRSYSSYLPPPSGRSRCARRSRLPTTRTLSAGWERFSGLRFGARSRPVQCPIAAQWPRLHPVTAPGRLGSGPGSRRHGFPREEAEGRGGCDRGNGQAGEAGWRPEGNGGSDRHYRALVRDLGVTGRGARASQPQRPSL